MATGVRHIWPRDAATRPAGAFSHAPPALRLVPRPEPFPRERTPTRRAAPPWRGIGVSAAIHAALIGIVLWQMPGGEPAAPMSVEVVFWSESSVATEAASGDVEAAAGEAIAADQPEPVEPPAETVAEQPPEIVEAPEETAAEQPSEIVEPPPETELAADPPQQVPESGIEAVPEPEPVETLAVAPVEPPPPPLPAPAPEPVAETLPPRPIVETAEIAEEVPPPPVPRPKPAAKQVEIAAAVPPPPPPRPRPAPVRTEKVEPPRAPAASEAAPPDAKPAEPAAAAAAVPPPPAETRVESAAAQAAVAAVPQATGEIPVIHEPRYRQRPTPARYPPRALDMNQQGIVIIRALVGPDGTSQEVVVWRSSGYSLLDAAAVRAARGWAFEPASVAGRRIASWVEVPVRFAIR